MDGDEARGTSVWFPRQFRFTFSSVYSQECALQLTVCLILALGMSIGAHWGPGKQGDTGMPSSEQEIALNFLCSRLPCWFLIFFFEIYHFMCRRILHTCISVLCVSCACRGQERHQIPWNWWGRQLWVAVKVLGTQPRSSGGAASALRCWDISPASWLALCKYLLHVCFPTL